GLAVRPSPAHPAHHARADPGRRRPVGGDVPPWALAAGAATAARRHAQCGGARQRLARRLTREGTCGRGRRSRRALAPAVASRTRAMSTTPRTPLRCRGRGRDQENRSLVAARSSAVPTTVPGLATAVIRLARLTTWPYQSPLTGTAGPWATPARSCGNCSPSAST